MSKLSTKLQHHKNISNYLLELEILANRKITRDEISSLEVVHSIRKISLQLNNYSTYTFSIAFSEKESNRFKSFIDKLSMTNCGQVYIWTERTNVCGLFKVNNIKDINFSFPFDINPEGILVFVPVTLEDQLLLDFSLDSTGKQIIEVETQGRNWSKITY